MYQKNFYFWSVNEQQRAMTKQANLRKYFATCRTYSFVMAIPTGIRVRFVFHDGSTLSVFATNKQMEEFM